MAQRFQGRPVDENEQQPQRRGSRFSGRRVGQPIPYETTPAYEAPQDMVEAYNPVTKRVEMEPREGRAARYVARETEDLARSIGGGLQRGVVALPQLPAAVGNLVARLDRRNTEGADELGGGGVYNPPFITREEWLQGARDLGVLSEEPYYGGTPISRVIQGGSEALAEGGTGGLVRRGAGRGLARLSQRFADRSPSVLEEAVTSGAAGLGAQAAIETPGLGVIEGAPLAAGLISGLVAGRYTMSDNNARAALRARVGNIPDSVFDEAQSLIDSAASQGITLGPDEALMRAAFNQGVETGGLESLSRAVRGSDEFGAPMRQMEAERFAPGGSARSLLDEFASELPDYNVGDALQREGSGVVRGLRAERTEMLRPYAEAARETPITEATRDTLRRVEGELFALENNSANPAVAREARRARESLYDEGNRLRIRSAMDLKDWADGVNSRIGSQALREEGSFGALDGAIGPIVARVRGAMDDYPALVGLNENYAQVSRSLVNPVEDVLSGLSDPNARREASTVFNFIARGGDLENRAAFRRAFDQIRDANPEVAQDALDVFVGRQIEDLRGGLDDPSVRNRAGQTIYRNLMTGNNRAAIEIMMDSMDQVHGLDRGQTFSAFSNAMEVLRTTSMRSGGVESATAGLSQASGITGSAQRVLEGVGGIGASLRNMVSRNSFGELGRRFSDPSNLQYIRELAGTDPNTYRARYLTAIMMGQRPDEIDPRVLREEMQGDQLRNETQRRIDVRAAAGL